MYRNQRHPGFVVKPAYGNHSGYRQHYSGSVESQGCLKEPQLSAMLAQMWKEISDKECSLTLIGVDTADCVADVYSRSGSPEDWQQRLDDTGRHIRQRKSRLNLEKNRKRVREKAENSAMLE
jgi:hypothetical protein